MLRISQKKCIIILRRKKTFKTFYFFGLTCLVGAQGSLCLSWLADVAGNERPLGWVGAGPACCLTRPFGAPQTRTTVPGCGENDSLIAVWQRLWRRLDWNLEGGVRRGLTLSLLVPCLGTPQSMRSSLGGPGWSVSISWGPGCLQPTTSQWDQENTADCSKGCSLMCRKKQEMNKTVNIETFV